MQRIKFLSQQRPHIWSSYFPTAECILGNLQFVFDPNATNYDWLVIYGELPALGSTAKTSAREQLQCHPHNTILITTEPESIKLYDTYFTRQFGTILSSQPQWALPHPSLIQRAALNHWFYGITDQASITHSELIQGPDPALKQPKVSMVFSPKAMRHTQHAKRFDFMTQIMQRMPEIECYGRGAKTLVDKAEALDRYQYHIAIENHFSPHHITEKLTDGFLGRCLTFYAGAPNAQDYFPSESFVPLNLDSPQDAAKRIRQAIAEDLYSQRLQAIEEARHRVLQSHNLFAAIAEVVQAAPQRARPEPAQAKLLGRHTLRHEYPWRIPKIWLDKVKLRIKATVQQKRYQHQPNPRKQSHTDIKS
jgi:hypothetical protein